jgi:hypothetical protein
MFVYATKLRVMLLGARLSRAALPSVLLHPISGTGEPVRRDTGKE